MKRSHSYYTEVALSRTNSGMDIKDFQADKKMKLFLNAFSFTDKNANSTEALKKKYTGLVIYREKDASCQNQDNIRGQNALVAHSPVALYDLTHQRYYNKPIEHIGYTDLDRRR